jgi:hypothetical protein
MKKRNRVFTKKTRLTLVAVIDNEIRRAFEAELINSARCALRDELRSPAAVKRIQEIAAELIRGCEEMVTDPLIWRESRAELAEHLTKLMGERMRNQMQVLVMQAIPAPPNFDIATGKRL